MVLNIGLGQLPNNTTINISFGDAPGGNDDTTQPQQGLPINMSMGQHMTAKPAQQAIQPASIAPQQVAMAQQQGINIAINPAMLQRQPRYTPIMSQRQPRYTPIGMSNSGRKGSSGVPTSDLSPEGVGSQSTLSNAIQNVTGHRRGQPAPGSQLDKANEILDAVISDPRWQEAEAKKRAQAVSKNGESANEWDVLSNTAFHSGFNGLVNGGNVQGGDISAIQDDAEKVLTQIINEFSGGDPKAIKFLLAALHFKTTGVDLSNRIGKGQEKFKPKIADDTLTDKPKRSEETKVRASDYMDPMGFATFVGWNHDFSDGKVDLKLNRPTLDKEVIFKGADPMGHMGETLEALKAIDPSATAADAYDLSYHDIIGNLLSDEPKKLDTQNLVTTRLEQLGNMAGGEKQKGVKAHIKAMIDKVGDVAKKNPELASAIAGGAAGMGATMATGCPFAGMTAGMGAAMASHMKLKE
jgi:hypothetical protein